MRENNTQINRLVESLSKAGFSPMADFKHGIITLNSLPEFKDKLAFSLVITMDAPSATEWNSLFDGCSLESGRVVKGAPHRTGIYSRKKAVERAKQEKWAALWSLYDAGILSDDLKPAFDKWEDVTLP